MDGVGVTVAICVGRTGTTRGTTFDEHVNVGVHFAEVLVPLEDVDSAGEAQPLRE